MTAAPGLGGSDFLIVEARAGASQENGSNSPLRGLPGRAASAALLAPAFGWLAALLALGALGRALHLRYPRPAALALQLPPTAFCLMMLLMSLDSVTGLA